MSDIASADAPLEMFDALCRQFREVGRNPDYLIARTKFRAGGTRWLHGFTLVAVDDSPTNLEILTRILESAGATVFACASGRSAIERVGAEKSRIDLILMDLQMPDMDGCEATATIRALPGTETIPIIALTAGATSSERDRALSSGMSDFLTKPIDAASLIKAVRKHVQARSEPIGKAR